MIAVTTILGEPWWVRLLVRVGLLVEVPLHPPEAIGKLRLTNLKDGF